MTHTSLQWVTTSVSHRLASCVHITDVSSPQKVSWPSANKNQWYWHVTRHTAC